MARGGVWRNSLPPGGVVVASVIRPLPITKRGQVKVHTLWEERFKRLLSEGDEKALMTVAAYIDLNPVRAGMVDRVEDYRWCGYASAVAGNRWARESLGRIFRHSPRISWEDWEELAIFRNVEKKTSHPHPEREKFTINYRLFLQSQGKTPERINQGIATLGGGRSSVSARYGSR